MNDSLISGLLGQLQGAPAGQIARQLGTDPQTAQNAIAAALPMMLGAMGRNAQAPGGADALFGALQRDHLGAAGGMDLGGLLGSLLGGGNSGGAGAGMGGLGDLLGSVLGGGAPASRQVDAGGILGHIFGGAQPRAESGLGQATGLNGAQVSKLLMMLAPIVMGFLAKQVSARNMDAGGLGQVLGQEHAQVQQQSGGLLDAVLDQNGDGKVDLSDLMKIGGSLLGGRR
ncbi:MAG: DUF937 domain-containing protein [Ottowia sp.]|uniref:DUF937 domain-containing protein n=1 Tax=Ottowia sp. TaxID=1898956 RepID=UPI0039E498AB